MFHNLHDLFFSNRTWTRNYDELQYIKTVIPFSKVHIKDGSHPLCRYSTFNYLVYEYRNETKKVCSKCIRKLIANNDKRLKNCDKEFSVAIKTMKGDVNELIAKLEKVNKKKTRKSSTKK